MVVEIVFETHSISEDNEAGNATGWKPGRLSERGREAAVALGKRRRKDGIDAVFCSDLWRAVETARIAFEGVDMPILLDWRLRECDYGEMNGYPAADVHRDLARRIDEPYPGGESWREAIARVCGLIDELPSLRQWRRVLVIGHMATWYGFEHRLRGRAIEEVVTAKRYWQEGWAYRLASLAAK